MNRQDYVDFFRDYRRRNNRRLLVFLVFLIVWMFVLMPYGRKFFDERDLDWIIVAAAVPVVIFLAGVVVMFYQAPNCPHCGVRLLGPFMPVAIASGTCGYCGKSLEA